MRRVQRSKRKSQQSDVQQFENDVSEVLNYKETAVAVTFVKHKTGEISIVTNDCDPVELIGLIEVGKQFVYENRWGADE